MYEQMVSGSYRFHPANSAQRLGTYFQLRSQRAIEDTIVL